MIRVPVMRKRTVEVNGKKFTRKSAREYVVAIVGQWSVERDRLAARRAYASDSARRDFEWYRDVSTSVSQERKEHLRSITFEQYAAEQIALRLDAIERKKAAGGYGFKVLGWSQSRENGDKAAVSYRRRGYLNVHVVPVGASIMISDDGRSWSAPIEGAK